MGLSLYELSDVRVPDNIHTHCQPTMVTLPSHNLHVADRTDLECGRYSRAPPYQLVAGLGHIYQS